MQRNLFVSLAAAIAVLAGCGGSSSSNNNNNNNTTQGARVSQGALTAVSGTAITLNGASIDVPSTTVVKVDDNPTGHEVLQPGLVVTVKVDDNGKATEINHRAAIRGRIDDASKTASTVTIAGQVVRVDDSTHFEDDTLRPASLSSSTRVRVSGFPDDRGGLRASRIARDTSTEFEFEVHGIVSNLDATAKTFTLKTSNSAGAATYSVTASAIPAGVKDGSIVEVRSTQPASGSNAIANATVKLDDDLSGQSEAELEGVVTSGSSTSFVIAGRTITTSGSTKWVGGAPADLVAGVRVEAEGTLDSSGNIAARKVVFHDSLRLQGLAASPSGDLKSGTFTMMGGQVTVHVSDVTELEDGLTLAAGSITAAAIEVRGYPSATGGADLVATRIRLASGGNADRIFIQGPVSNIDKTARSFKILVFTIDASSASPSGREGAAFTGDINAFIGALSDGSVVKARGRTAAALTGTTLKAEEVELEDDK